MEGRTFCKQCGEPLSGRSDKKFCSDCCRNRYNNARNSVPRPSHRELNRRLGVNYKLLSRLVSLGRKVISISELESMGFLKTVCTGCRIFGFVCAVYNCYEIKYIVVGGYVCLLKNNA